MEKKSVVSKETEDKKENSDVHLGIEKLSVQFPAFIQQLL